MEEVRLSNAIEFSEVLYLAQDCSWTNRRGDVVALKVVEGGVFHMEKSVFGLTAMFTPKVSSWAPEHRKSLTFNSFHNKFIIILISQNTV
jgi:hypothetical protein